MRLTFGLSTSLKHRSTSLRRVTSKIDEYLIPLADNVHYYIMFYLRFAAVVYHKTREARSREIARSINTPDNRSPKIYRLLLNEIQH